MLLQKENISMGKAPQLPADSGGKTEATEEESGKRQDFPPPCPVNSHNEWDPLEEVIIGNVEQAVFTLSPPQDSHIFFPKDLAEFSAHLPLSAPYPAEILARARKALDDFIHILRAEGVIVRRLDPYDFTAGFSTPAWKSPSGFCAANPRDPFLIIGNEIIETPMSSRDRFFEPYAYRKIFKEYFQAGAKWTAAPKPQLLDALYDEEYKNSARTKRGVFCLTEFEPVFDAADFVRCGRDIFGQLSNVTNKLGVEWLRRHLGDTYRIHLIDNLDRVLNIDVGDNVRLIHLFEVGV